MVKQSTLRQTWLRISVVACVALFGVPAMRGQHAFEYAARVGANALLYKSDYGKPQPGYNVGMDFSWKYRSPYYVGVRLGLGVDVAASTFVGKDPNGTNIAYSDSYIVPQWYEPDGHQMLVRYQFGKFSETQQMIIASVPVQLGLFVGDFSMFVGARFGVPVHACYWQSITNSNMALYFGPTGDYPIDASSHGTLDPSTGEPTVTAFNETLKSGNVPRTVNGIGTLTSVAYPQYNYHITAMIDLNYSFKVGDNTDFAVGAYLEYDPIGYKPKVTDNTSLMQWHYTIDDHTNNPVFRRDYGSVLESNRADGVSMHQEGDLSGSPIVSMYHRTSVGVRLSVSLWSVPLDFGKNYRKQQLYKVCMCDFF